MRRLWLYALLALAGLTSLLLDVFTLSPVVRPASLARRAPRPIPNTDVNPFGVNVFLHNEVEAWKKRLTMEMIADAGIGWVKQQFPWEEIEPLRDDDFWDDRNNKSSWDKFDEIVTLAEEWGLEVIARLDRPPAWARPAGTQPTHPPEDPRAYADFVYDFVQHYRGRIHYIQIWNEPNLDREWVEGQPVDPRNYVTLLCMAYRKAKEADPNIQVLSAPLAARTTDDPNRVSLSDLTYLEEMYRAGAAPCFDILSANAYGRDDPPEAAPDPGQYNFRRAELVRLIMVKYGDEDKAIWFNEYGWNAAPADMPPERLIWDRVSDEQQARWTVEGIQYAQEHWPWAGVLCIWYFRQVGGEYPQTDAAYYFRMVNEDFTPMPVYNSVKEATRAFAVATPGWYEETAAPVRRQAGWLLGYTLNVDNGAYAMSSAPGSKMMLTFLGTDLSLRVRQGPDGGQLLVSVDGGGGRLTSLPRDSFGQAFLDLYGPEEKWIDVHLVQGLGREFPLRPHRLELTVAQEQNEASEGHLCALDTLEVDYRPSYTIFWALAGAFGGVVLVGLVGLSLEIRRTPAPRPRAVPINPWTLRAEQLEPRTESPGVEASRENPLSPADEP